eukprot:4344544-Amphidinium_carterae.1
MRLLVFTNDPKGGHSMFFFGGQVDVHHTGREEQASPHSASAYPPPSRLICYASAASRSTLKHQECGSSNFRASSKQSATPKRRCAKSTNEAN